MTGFASSEFKKDSDICKYEFCIKRVWRAEGGGRSEFCGLFHRDLYMADVYDRLHPERKDQLPLRNTEQGQCMLWGCRARRRVDPSTGLLFDFCGASHVLKYTRACTSKWYRENRLCEYNNCFRHVFVDDRSLRPSTFCSMKHAIKAAAAESVSIVQNALGFGVQDKTLENVDRDYTQVSRSLQDCSLDEDTRGYHDKLNARIMVDCLQLAHQLPCRDYNLMSECELFRYFCVGINIFDYHPWELLKEGKGLVRYFLHLCHDDKKLSTKEGFRYKQSSNPHPSRLHYSEAENQSLLRKRYLTYELKNNDPDGDRYGDHVRIYRTYGPKSDRWRLHEIRLQSPQKSHAVIWMIKKNAKGGPVCCEGDSSSADHSENMQVESESLDRSASSVAKLDDELEDRAVWSEDETRPADLDQDMEDECPPPCQHSPPTQDGTDKFLGTTEEFGYWEYLSNGSESNISSPDDIVKMFGCIQDDVD